MNQLDVIKTMAAIIGMSKEVTTEQQRALAAGILVKMLSILDKDVSELVEQNSKLLI